MSIYKGTNSEILALNTFVKLIRAAETLAAKAHGPLAIYKLTVSQFAVLEVLYHLGPLCQRDIAKKILKTAGNLTTVIDNLEKRQLVARQRSDHDRRYMHVALTEAGEELIARIFPEHARTITRELGFLTPGEQKLLGRLCKKLSFGA